MMLGIADLDEIAGLDDELVAEGDKPIVAWRRHLEVGPYTIHLFGMRDGHYAAYVTSGSSQVLRLRGSAKPGGIDRAKVFMDLVENPAAADVLEDLIGPGIE